MHALAYARAAMWFELGLGVVHVRLHCLGPASTCACASVCVWADAQQQNRPRTPTCARTGSRPLTPALSCRTSVNGGWAWVSPAGTCTWHHHTPQGNVQGLRSLVGGLDCMPPQCSQPVVPASQQTGPQAHLRNGWQQQPSCLAPATPSPQHTTHPDACSFAGTEWMRAQEDWGRRRRHGQVLPCLLGLRPAHWTAASRSISGAHRLHPSSGETVPAPGMLALAAFCVRESQSGLSL